MRLILWNCWFNTTVYFMPDDYRPLIIISVFFSYGIIINVCAKMTSHVINGERINLKKNIIIVL